MNKQLKPMLAQKYDNSRVDYTDDVVFMQPKLDGVRCLFTKDGAFSRTGKRFMNVDHIEKDLKNFFKDYPFITLDGELYNHDLKHDFEKIISLVRKTKPTKEHKAEAKQLVQYHIYDFMGPLSIDYDKRMAMLSGLDIFNSHIKLIETHITESHDVSVDLHKKFLKRGYEGSILRLNRPYVNRRSFHLMKFKDFSDDEATIIDYVPGKGKREGTIGKFIMIDSKGVKFGCPPGKGFKHKHLAWMLANVDLFIGKSATFTYFQRTNAGSYRHPQFKAIRDYE